MLSYLGSCLLKNGGHNGTRYRVIIDEYTKNTHSSCVRDLVSIVKVQMKVLCFWISIWKEKIDAEKCGHIDIYESEVEYAAIKAEDIFDCLKF